MEVRVDCPARKLRFTGVRPSQSDLCSVSVWIQTHEGTESFSRFPAAVGSWYRAADIHVCIFHLLLSSDVPALPVDGSLVEEFRADLTMPNVLSEAFS